MSGQPIPISLLLTTLLVDDDAKRTPEARQAYADYLTAYQTPSERMMARVLFHLGIEVEPQAVVRGFIVDFLDRARGVIFEVDGGVHNDRKVQDARRDAIMEKAGYRVIRITNEGVQNLMANIAATAELP